MYFEDEIAGFVPGSELEAMEQQIILDFIRANRADVLYRKNQIAHMSSSAMIFNKDFTKVLMAWHNIYQSWAWSGGHADGEVDLCETALKEAGEETGITGLCPLGGMMALDILTVNAHVKKGKPVNAHLHLNVTYCFTADDTLPLVNAPEENSAVAWLEIDKLHDYVNEVHMYPVYDKIISRTLKLKEELAK